MNDPFALDLTIILLLLGIGSAMVAGNVAAFFKNNENFENLYMRRSIFLIFVGLLITFWSIASLLNR